MDENKKREIKRILAQEHPEEVLLSELEDVQDDLQKVKNSLAKFDDPDFLSQLQGITDEELQEALVELRDELESKLNKIKLTPGPKGDKGERGERGEKGKDGKDGKDGRDGKDGEDGRDGKDGKDGKDGDEITAEEVRDKLETLKKDDRLDVSAIKGLDDFGDGIEKRAIDILDQRTQFLINKKTSTTFQALTDTPSSYSGQSLKGVRVNSGETGLEFYTTVTDTDEKVALESGDTAGYLNAKLGEVGINTDTNGVDSIEFDTSYTVTGSEPTGALYWDSVHGTASLRTSDDSILQLGQETRFYGKASGAISNGELVQFAGSQGDHVLFKKVVPAEVIANSKLFMGVATEDIANGEFGNVTRFGYVTMNTTGWSAGDLLYFDNTTGQLTNTAPNAPEITILVAAVVKEESSPAAANGIILVRPTWGHRMQDLDDFDGTPLTTDGQIPVWDNTNQYFDPNYNINDYFHKTNDSASDVQMSEIGTAAYSNVQQMQDIFHSTGAGTGGTITDNGNGTYSVASGSGYIRATTDPTSTLYTFDWVANNSLTPNDGRNYVGVEYNGGSPQIVQRASYNWNYQTDFPLGEVVKEGSVLHIFNAQHKVGDHAGKMIESMEDTMSFARDNRTGGLILGETGTRNITMSAGYVWFGLTEYAITAKDTSVADTIETYYRDGAGGWTLTTGVTQWQNSQYDNNSGTLQNLTANRYAVNWFYLDVEGNGQVVMVYPQAQYTTLAQAEADSPPSTLPDRLQSHGKLIGRIVFQQGGATAQSVETVFTTLFSSSQIVNHNSLAGLQGGTAGEYYHLTSAEKTVVENTSGTNTGDVTVSDSSEIDFTLTGQDLTASLITGSIDILKLDSGVQTSLGLADTSVQPLDNISTLTNDAGYISDITGESFTDLSDTPASYVGQGLKGVRVNVGETALEFYDTVTDTDEKVKYNTDDASAGYLADKVTAGTGISLAEATDTLQITNSDTGSSAVSTHESTYDHTKLHDPVTVADSAEIDFTLTGQQITASIVAGSIDETKLDTSVNSSLDLADSAIQVETDPLSLHLDQTTPQSIVNISGVTIANNDKVLILDTSGSDTVKTVTTQNIADLYSETDPVFTASDFNGKSVVTTIGSPGTDSNIPTEQAVREAISSFGGGDVSGPASSTDSAIVLFDGITGKLIKDSTKLLSAYFEKAVDDTDDISEGTTNKFNVTHTGEVTGATSLTIDKTAITNRDAGTVASGDLVLVSDIDDTNNLKKVTAQDIADLSTSVSLGTQDQIPFMNAGGTDFDYADDLTYDDTKLQILTTNPELRLTYDDANDYYTRLYRTTSNTSYLKSFVGVPGGTSKAISMSGGNDRVDYGAVSEVDFTDGAGTDEAFSVSLAFNSALTGTQYVVGNLGGGGTGGWLVYFVNGVPYIQLRDSSNNYIFKYGQSALSASTDHLVTFTYDGTEVLGGINIYVDGSAISTFTGNSGTYTGLPAGRTLSFGNLPGGTSNGWSGNMDRIIVWNEERSLADHQSEWNSGTGTSITSDPNAVIIWNFEDDLTDDSGNGIDGTLQAGSVSYVTGWLPTASANTEVTILTMEDGLTGNAQGKITLGNTTSDSVIAGGDISLQISGTEEWNIDSNGDLISTNNGNIKLQSDTSKLYFGAGDDASMTFDGTHSFWITGSDSVIIGDAGTGSSFNGSEYSNILIGKNAGQAITAGNNNVFIGQEAGYSSIDEFGNIAIGDYAFRNNSTGYYNTSIGMYAMNQSSSGWGNVFYGFQAGYSNSTGFTNTGIGYYSLHSVGSSSRNSALGEQSLRYLNGGNSNIAIGYLAGTTRSGGTLTNATDSIFIGRSTGASANSETNQIVIGTSVNGNGSNTTTIGNSSTTHFYPMGTVVTNNPVRLTGYTVATLPTGTQGDTAFVTDASSPTYLATVSGGGSTVTPVFYDGTNWVCH